MEEALLLKQHDVNSGQEIVNDQLSLGSTDVLPVKYRISPNMVPKGLETAPNPEEA